MRERPHPNDPARTALLVIDMQNDVLAEGGAFSKRHCDPHQLAQSVAWLVRAARAQGRAVVWVTSAYGEIDAAPDALRGQTHTGSACCACGTWGAELFPALAPVRAERPAGAAEWHVEKRWYSAFRDTDLIRQEGDAEGEDRASRISLTFRHIGTFHDPATGAV
ncbi:MULTISPECIES: cysteine hydrolase family protein [Sorangium]|uniref:Isochorismatase-like domain-containing protein n=1 Tax=Sorangium cellulosum TaxID=56 RepID=A0A4P2QJ00_SORCE|nr:MULTISPECIES: isochorismatase family protein [Sorangium]AUX29638.1 uncharacterized protein SOCE836_017290 [Sorangium cellulosum]WCQ89027.1 hypothetical protein NQZ70_01712 [Sorangium sp. Soce836]